MAQCPVCGASVADGDVQCTACGTSLQNGTRDVEAANEPADSQVGSGSQNSEPTGRTNSSHAAEHSGTSRRDILKIGGAAVTIGGLGGYYLLGGGSSGNAAWSTFRGDPARTGTVPAGSAPGESVEIGWERTLRDVATAIEGIEFGDDQTIVRHDISSPILADDLVVFSTSLEWMDFDAGESHYDPRVFALDSGSGSLEWSVSLDPDGAYRGQRWWSPEADNGNVYVPMASGGDLTLGVIDTENGEVTERYPVRGNYQPTVADGRVYMAARGDGKTEIVAYDDGTERWSRDTYDGLVRPGRLTVANGLVQYFDASREIVALDASDGTERWRRSVEVDDWVRDGNPAMLTSPVVVGSSSYVAGSVRQLVQYGNGEAVAVNTGDGTERWRYVPPGAESSIVASILLGGNPDLSEEELSRLPEFAALYGYPLVVDGQVLVTGIGDPPGETSEEATYLFAMDRTSGSLQWAVETGLAVTPVAAGDVIYMMTGAGVEVVSASGDYLDSLALEEYNLSVTLSPAVGYGRVFVPTMRGIVALE